MPQPLHQHLYLKPLGIDTQQEHVIYMRRDCAVCRAEGFEAQARVQVSFGTRHILATLNVVESDLLAHDELSLSTRACEALGVRAGDPLLVSHAPTLDSLSALRAKIFGHTLDAQAYLDIIRDVAHGHYTDMHLAAFLTACAAGRMSAQETTDLTHAMVQVGEVIDWGTHVKAPIADKHCVGGLPGNRTTPIVVAIVAAAGLTIPKTSSRAITSPAGTADVMETLTHVALDVPTLRRVVEREGGCLAWGGALSLSPADDVLIRVERPLDLDSEAQLVASILSKKIAAGATHAVIDVPVGPTTKVRNDADAQSLHALLEHVAHAHGLKLRVLHTEGLEPVGRGIGPALEAHDVLAVLRGEASAPADLRRRALDIAAALLELCDHSPEGSGRTHAQDLLASGAAWAKFQAICIAQGGLREPGVAPLQWPLVAEHEGFVTAIDNRRLARVAKLAGAPLDATAGVVLHVRLGDYVHAGTPLITLHAVSPGELTYARQYLATHPALTLGEEMSA